MIDWKVEEIISKYNIDKYYPRYRKMIEAKRLIIALAQHWDKKRVLCVCVSNICKLQFQKAIASVENVNVDYYVVEYADCYIKNTIAPIEKDFDTDYDEVWIISCKGRFFVYKGLEQSFSCDIKDLYVYFDLKGLVLDDEWYSLFQHNTGEFTSLSNEILQLWNNHPVIEYLLLKEQCNRSSSIDEKRIILIKMLFVALYIRDFLEAFRLLDILVEYDDTFSGVKSCLVELINYVTEKLHKREQKDVFCAWIDKVPYVDFGKLQSVYEICKNRALIFRNFYTMNPYTIPSFAQMFAGKKPIDGEGIFVGKDDIENGELINALEDKGYDVLFVGADFESHTALKHQSTRFHDEFTPCSIVLWDSIRGILNSDKPVFVIGQIGIEGHEPNMSISLCNEKNLESRYNSCLNHIDKQLSFYINLLNESCTEIIMSDHGKKDFKTRFHIIMAIKSKDIKKGFNDSLYSLLDFKSLVMDIIDGGGSDSPLRIKERDYVEIQDYNHMSGFDIGVAIKKRGRIDDLIRGYRGIITKEYIYIHFSNGNEWLSQNDAHVILPYEPTWFQRESDLVGCSDPGVIEKLKRLSCKNTISENQIAIHEKYNKYVWKIYNNAIDKNKRKIELVNKLFSSFLNSEVALRFGGYHSYGLITILTEENKNKIACIIDKNRECLCSKMGIQVVSKVPKEIRKIVISSKGYDSDFVPGITEMDQGRIEIINLYEYLRKCGIVCKWNCFDFEPDYNDYDVDYPFDDFYL